MAQYTLKYDSKFAGAKAVAADGATYTTGVFNGGTQYSTAGGSSAICTGYYYDTDGMSVYIQTTTGVYLYVNLNSPKWSFSENAQTIHTYSQSQAQALVNEIIKNNKTILANNLLCARFASKLTKAQQQQVRELQERLQERNSALQAEGLTSNVQTSYPAGYAELSAYLDALMAGNTIGLATWAIVVIACTVVAATATAAYFAYKYYADQSEKDVKFSKELTKTLTSKLTEEEYQQLLNETKGIVTKSRIKQSLSDYSKVLITAGLIVGGAFLYRYVKNKI